MAQSNKLSHDIRGQFNALKLCVAAMQISDTLEDKMMFVDHIEKATTEIDRLVELVPPEESEANPQP